MIITNVQHFSDIEKIQEAEFYEFCDEYEANPDLGEDRIIIYGPLYRLRGTDLIMAEGTYCCYNEDTGELEPDFSVSLIYKSEGEPDLDSCIYWESSSIPTTFHNFVMQTQMEDAAVVLLENAVA